MEEINDSEIKKSKLNMAILKPYLFMSIRLSSWIIVPVFIGVFLGRWLDEKYGTQPWLFLGSIGIAFAISMIGLIKNTIEAYKNINDAK